jgi:protein involved in polysaccharide export with SLBB domain
MYLRPISPAFLLASMAFLGGQVQAQFAPQNPIAAAAQQAVPGGVQPPTLGAAQPAALGLVQPPSGVQRPDLQRPDLGEADVQPTPPISALAQAKKPKTPTQFQRFVQSSTSQLLPHFGEQLFDNPNAYAPVAAAPAPAEYVLGPGDEVRVQIWGAVDFAGNQTLDRNGQISLPKIGVINLNGVQVKNLETTLRKQAGTVFNNIQLNASLGKLRGITVYVVGQAQQPGTYNLNSLSTLVNAVFASGGPGVNGSMRAIQLKRGGQTVTTLDLYDFIAQGDKSKDAPLQPGDVIMIPPAGPRVALTGATDQAAIYELKPGNTLQDVLSLGGGVPVLANLQKALLERIDASQATTPRQVQNLVLNAQGLMVPLRDGDLVTLLPISQAFGNAVTLQGNVAQPLRNAWFSGMRVQDLIPDREALITPEYYHRKNQLVQNRTAELKAQGLTAAQILDVEKAQKLPENLALSMELISTNPDAPTATKIHAGATVADRVRGMVDQINWDYAVIERLNKADLRTELIPFNLGKAITQKDPAHNLQLQAGDVVTVLSSTDVRLPSEQQIRLVRLEGEVAAPGVYQAQPGETLPQLIARAGGLTPQAYVFGTEFTRESVRQQQQKNLDLVIRNLESQAQSASATLAANLTGERASQAATLQQQQLAQQRAQIDRLKALRSEGRVSLELDPEKTTRLTERASGSSVQELQTAFNELPSVPLLDGDAIVVPSQPAFVAAAGSVINENVILFKPGRTVGDLIKTAGLAEDANEKQAFVLRADGSILSRRQAGLFSSFESLKVMPGDTVIVPAKVDRESNYNFIVRGLRDWTQIFSNLGIGAAAIQTLRN